MSDVDPTPTTPVTIGDRLGWFRGDLAARLDALSTQLAGQHTALLAKLDEISGGVTLAQLLTAVQAGASGGATEATVAAILAAIGELSTYPADWTVRALLGQLTGYVDTAPVPGTPPFNPPSNNILNPDPGGCSAVVGQNGRATMIPTGDWITVGAQDCDIWAMANVAIPGLLLSTSNPWVMEVDQAFYDAHPLGIVRFCVSWNFTGNLPVLHYMVRQGDFSGTVGTPYTMIVPTISGIHGGIELRPLPQYPFVSVYFAVPQGNTIAQNVFYHVESAYPN